MSAPSTIENGCACGDRGVATGVGKAMPCVGGANGCACGDNEQCTAVALTALTVTTQTFDTEAGFDSITIGGTVYSGSSGPSGVSMAAGATLTWLSDSSATAAGWTLCATAAQS